MGEALVCISGIGEVWVCVKNRVSICFQLIKQSYILRLTGQKQNIRDWEGVNLNWL